MLVFRSLIVAAHRRTDACTSFLTWSKFCELAMASLCPVWMSCDNDAARSLKAENDASSAARSLCEI
jgi:hypothetical protein